MNITIVFLCIEIFLCRVFDVSMGTIRTIITVRGKPLIAAIIGFIEVFIWFIIVRQALNTDETSLLIAFSYAAGYAMGTWVGGVIAKNFVKTKLDVQIVLSNKNEELLKALKDEGFPITILDVKGYNKNENKYMLLIEIDSKQYKFLKQLVLTYDPSAFITTNEIKDVMNGYFSSKVK